MAIKNRKKLDRRAEIRSKKKRTEKQVVLARHKQGKKAAARRLGISAGNLRWTNDRLVFAANGESVRDALLMRGTTPRVKVVYF